jgi:hypothetical protein
MRNLSVMGVLLGLMLGIVACQSGDDEAADESPARHAAVQEAICTSAGFTGGRVLLYEAPVDPFLLEQTSDEPAFYAVSASRVPCRELEVLGASKKVVNLAIDAPPRAARWVLVSHANTRLRGWTPLPVKRFPGIAWAEVPVRPSDALFHTANWRRDVIEAICRANRVGGAPFWKARELRAHLFQAPGSPERENVVVGFHRVARKPCRSLRLVAKAMGDATNSWVLVETKDRSASGWTSLGGHGSGNVDDGAGYVPKVTFDWSEARLAAPEALGPKSGLPDLEVRFRRVNRPGDPCPGPGAGKEEPWSAWILNRGPGLGPPVLTYTVGRRQTRLRLFRRPFPGETIDLGRSGLPYFPGETRIEVDPRGVVRETTEANNAVKLPPAPTLECQLDQGFLDQ